MPPTDFEEASPSVPWGFLHQQRLLRYISQMVLTKWEPRPDQALAHLAPELGETASFETGVKQAYRSVLDLYNKQQFEGEAAASLLHKDLQGLFRLQMLQHQAQKQRDRVEVGVFAFGPCASAPQ
jgi:hypothetical protein